MSKNTTPGVPGQEIDPSVTTNPATEPEGDLLAEVEASDNAVIASLPNVERAAFKRELMSALSRATWAAERLADLTPEEPASAEPAPEDEEEGPITEPHRPAGRSLAMLSDGSVALSLTYLEGADLAGRTRWEGIILEPEEAEEVLDGLSDAADDVAPPPSPSSNRTRCAQP
jgi:hypothetical protein